MKYPTIESDNKQVEIRALPFNPEFLGLAKAKLVEKNVFVKNIKSVDENGN